VSTQNGIERRGKDLTGSLVPEFERQSSRRVQDTHTRHIQFDILAAAAALLLRPESNAASDCSKASIGARRMLYSPPSPETTLSAVACCSSLYLREREDFKRFEVMEVRRARTHR
jgi:hypothetical protein